MNYYFNFFDDTKKEYFKINKDNNNIKTNIVNFNLKIFYNETGVRPDKVTDFKLMIERENNGVYYHYKKLDATLDNYEMTLNFNNCKLDTNEFTNDKFKIYLVLYENGIPVFTSVNSPAFVNLKTKADEFDIDVDNTKKIDGVFEIQSSSEVLTKIDLTIRTQDNSISNNLLYYCKISNDENIKYGQFDVLGTNEKRVEIFITPTNFINNETYVHVAIKDIFGNINYKKFKLLALGNNFSSFEVFSNDLIIEDLLGNIDLYIDFRNVTAITPVITYKDNNSEVKQASPNQIGTYNLEGGLLSFKPSEHFNFKSIMEAKNVAYLSFYLNGSDKLETKRITLLYDNASPVVRISNLDENNYGLTKSDSDYFKINGSFMEDNLFFIGRESKKCDFEEMQHTLIIKSEEDVSSVEFQIPGGTIKENTQKYGDIYICQSHSDNFKILDIEGVEINFESYVNDYVDSGYKKMFILLEKTKLSNYEKNIIENQGGLKLKGPLSIEASEQKFIDFDRFYIVDVKIENSKTGKFQFDLGIEDFDYSFLKHCLKDNVSSEITDIKQVEIGFDSSRIIAINTIKENNLIKFNSQKINGEYKFLKLGELSFKFLSLMSDEFFSTKENVSFFDDYLNSKEYENIHTLPVLKDENDINVEYINFKMNKSTSGAEELSNNYGFEFECPITDGLNNFKLFFYDIVNKESMTPFTIEKNNKSVEFTLETKEMTSSEIVKTDFGFTLTNNKDKSFIKILVKNETKKQKENERYIITKSGDKILKHKIITDNNVSTCTFSLENDFDGVQHSVFYNDLDNKKFDLLLIKKEDLTLNVESEFISGSNNYFLEFEKDDFSKIDLDYNNKDKFICALKDNFIEIIRTNNDNFMEELEISLKCYDNNGNFEIKSRTTKGMFYNDSILVGYEIQEEFLDDNYLISPIFNLEIKTYSKEVISYVSYHDNFEMDIFKRKKIARYDSEKEVYIIEGIVSPIEETSLTIDFNLKQNNLIIRKDVFVTDKLILKNEINEFLTSFNVNDGDIDFNVRSSTGKTELEEVSIIVNDIEVSSEKNIVFENEFDNKVFNISSVGMNGYNFFYLKFITKRGKVIYSKIMEYNFTKNVIDFKTYTNEENVILDKDSARNIPIRFKEKTGKIKLEITNMYDQVSECELFDGDNILDEFDIGIYNLNFFYLDVNNRKQLTKYKMQVFNEYGNHIELESRAFETIKKVCSFTIRNNSFIQNDKLNSYISIYINGNFVKNYFPKYENGKMNFEFEKKEGKIDIFYNDRYCNFKISSFEHKTLLFEKPTVYDFHTLNDEMFTMNSNLIKMVEYTDLMFQTKNINHIKIISKKFGRISEKRVSDKFKTSVSKIHMPCEIYFYDTNDNLVFEDPVIVSEYEKTRYNFKIKNTENPEFNKKTKITLNLGDYIKNNIVATMNVKLKHENNHIMYNTFKSIAIVNRYNYWLKLDKGKRNEIIKEINNIVYSELKKKKYIEITTELIKKEMIVMFKKKIGGINE